MVATILSVVRGKSQISSVLLVGMNIDTCSKTNCADGIVGETLFPRQPHRESKKALRLATHEAPGDTVQKV